MTRAAWVCDACESNNVATASQCRVCRRTPSSTPRRIVTPKAPPKPKPMPAPKAPTTTVVPTSRPHERTRRAVVPPGPPAEPPRFTLTAPARPVVIPAAPPPPVHPAPVPTPSSSGGPTGLVWFLIVLGLLIAYGVVSALNGDSGSSSDAPPPATSTPCPAAVSAWLPDGGSSATLIASYTTPKHEISLCRDAAGRPHYDGRVRGAAVTPDTHIALPATETSTGFIAVNGAFSYEIRAGEVLVSQNGTLLARTTLTRVAP